MISRFLKRKVPSGSPTRPAVPAGETIWAIGDVHGRLDLLDALVSAIRDEARAARGRKMVIFLGDYIDRGPDSRGVIRFLTGLDGGEGIEWRFLMGNHERTMLDFLQDPSVGVQWCEFGGEATLASYGLKLPHLRHKPEAWARVSADLDHMLAEPERHFLESLELSITVGDYFFVHAGARPGQPLDRQTSRDLLWIRNSFLDSETAFERVVVHGHTPTRFVHSDHRRIGLDTKAYASGVLSAVRFSGESRWLIQATKDPEGDSVSVNGSCLSTV